jgi:L-galactose dehydrogenase/L-glyceraldehyde 3-phosphate reductase
MTGDDHARQTAVLRVAIARGINWVDTAPGYGQGKSETNIGRALEELAGGERVSVATKVRLAPEHFGDIHGSIRRSVEVSLKRLRRSSITLLQLHNGLTTQRDDEPFSISPNDVLASDGVLDAFRELRDEKLIQFIGLTGTGHPEAMRQAVNSGAFDTIQVPYNLLNPSAGRELTASFSETNYGNIIADCQANQMGVFAIRVFAAGALLGNAPSAHTLKTPFFPLSLYERDRAKAAEMASTGGSLKNAAIDFVLNDRRVHSAIIGFGAPNEIEEALASGLLMGDGSVA